MWRPLSNRSYLQNINTSSGISSMFYWLKEVRVFLEPMPFAIGSQRSRQHRGYMRSHGYCVDSGFCNHSQQVALTPCQLMLLCRHWTIRLSITLSKTSRPIRVGTKTSWNSDSVLTPGLNQGSRSN